MDVDISQFPFGVIPEVFCGTRHTRRMAGILLACFPEITLEPGRESYCMSAEFATPLANTKTPVLIGRLLDAGFLLPGRVREIANISSHGTLVPGDEQFDNVVRALGSPLLGETAKEIWDAGFVGASPEHSPVFRAALYANPLIHSQHCPGFDGAVLGHTVFYENAARFGDLTNVGIADPLKSILDATTVSDAKFFGGILWSLLARKDLPDDVLVSLHNSPTASAQAYERLVMNPRHQKLVLSGAVEYAKFFDDEAKYVISPAATPTQIREIYTQGGAEERALQSLLTAAQCPEDIFKEISRKVDLLANRVFLERSPFAKTYIAQGGKNRFVETFRERLSREIGSDRRLRRLMPEAVPFDVIEPSQVRDVFPEPTHALAGFVIGAMRAREFRGRIGPVSGDIETALPRLFLADTPAASLMKVATLHPELAGLAAAHPNGIDIPLHKVSPAHRNVVAAVREATPLAGKADACQRVCSNGIVL